LNDENDDDERTDDSSNECDYVDESDDDIREVEPGFRIVSVREKNIKRYRTVERDYTIKVNAMERGDSFRDILFNLANVFGELLALLLEDVQPQDRVRLVISSRGLRHISLKAMSPSELTVEKILTEIERVTQSNDSWLFEGEFTVNFLHVRLPIGGGWARGIASLNDKIKTRKCFVEIKNKDELCLARAIVTAKARLSNHHNYECIRKGRPIQKLLAEKLHTDADVPKAKCGIQEMSKFQNFLSPDYQLVVFSSTYFNSVIFKGPPAEKQINVYHYNEHYATITKMPAFLGRSYYCTHCNLGYQNDNKHVCDATCACCKSDRGCTIVKWKNCEKCNRIFKSQACFDNHIRKNNAGNTVCDHFNKCLNCDKVFDTRQKHTCYTSYCNKCKIHKGADHECYIIKPKKKVKKIGVPKKYLPMVFFDFESTQETVLENGDKEHIPNLCVVHRCCGFCGGAREPVDNDDDLICIPCSSRLKHKNSEGENDERKFREEKVFSGPDTVKKFSEWLFQPENNGVVAIAHNNRGYDSYFILQYLHSQGIKPSHMIQVGQKVLSFQALGVKFIDSLSFLPMPLSKFPKTFNIDELKKGYFPHLFNTEENQNYEGGIPDKHFFDPDSMTDEGRAEFLKWYELQKDKTYVFRDELVSYCKSDVNILRRSCSQFASLFEQKTDVNPFKDSVTIASACSRVYRQNFMKTDSIAVLPPYGYDSNGKHSGIAVKWLEWIIKENNVNISHARNGGEKSIGNFKVDGLDEQNKTVYEFEGCFWHGCEKCFPFRETWNPRVGKTMGELHDSTVYRRNFIMSRGYKVVSKKECEFRSEIKKNKNLQTFTKDMSMHDPLNPRDAFFGGRTNAIKLYHKCESNEKIKYIDFTSLYPWVCKYQHYPCGHPKIYKGENLKQIDPLSCEGLIKCKILPPRGLYLPVLPMRIDKKLKFALCSACVLNESRECTHSEEERSIIGSWVIFEVKKAIEKGYKLIETYEVWHFNEETKYDLEKNEGGLFTPYIDHFLKIKQESSGWPEWCTTAEKKKQYIEKYEKHEGIKLDPRKILHNPGLRSIAKLCLNSIWGKFGQRPSFVTSFYTDSPEEYFAKFRDDSLEIFDVQYVNDKFVLMKYKEKEDFVEPCPYTNTVIAAYTTAHARLKLYSEIEKLGEQVLYFDTDSVIYVINSTNKKHYDPPIGDYLGDFTDEINGDSIEEFVSGGPKNYGYRLKESQKSICKVRGFTLNYNNSKKINFESMKELVENLNFSTKIPVVNKHKIRRKNGFKIVSTLEEKNYGLVYDKRYLHDDYTTLPFGY